MVSPAAAAPALPRHPGARELATLLAADRGKRPDRRSFDGIYEFMVYTRRCAEAARSPRFERTAFQIAVGLGWQLTDADRRARLRSANPTSQETAWSMYVRRRLKLAAKLGLIRYGIVRGAGLGGNRCYWIELVEPPKAAAPPGVDITAGQGRYQPQRLRTGTRRRPTCDDSSVSPARRPAVFFLAFRKFVVPTTSAASASPQRQEGGCMSHDSAARARSRAPAREGGAPNDGNEERGSGFAVLDGGVAVVETLRTELAAGAPVIERAMQAFELLLGRDARFSVRRWGDRLEKACRRGDRFGDFGAGGVGLGALALLDLIADQAAAESAYDEWAKWSCSECAGSGWREVNANTLGPCRCRLRERVPRPPQVQSLAYFVPQLEAVTARWRRADRLRQARELGIEVAPGEPVRARLRAARRASRRGDHDGGGK